MDRTNAGGIDFAEVAEPMLLRFGGVGLAKLIVARLADARAHLASGGVGECDRDQLTEASVFRVRICVSVEMGDEPLSEDERLAATSAGREGDGMLAAFNGSALFVG